MLSNDLKWKLAVATALLVWTTAPLANADEGDTGSATEVTDRADAATKTLPAHASDTAKANAFGQQGARQRAAHDADKAKEVHRAAKAAAANEAQRAIVPALPAQAIAGRSHAQGPGSSAPPAAAQSGLDRAASHRPADVPLGRK